MLRIINASSVVRNKHVKRNPKMPSAKTRNQYDFGINTGVDDESGLLRNRIGTAATVVDVPPPLTTSPSIKNGVYWRSCSKKPRSGAGLFKC